MSSNPGSFQSFDQRQQVVTARVVLRLRGRAVAVSTRGVGFHGLRVQTHANQHRGTGKKNVKTHTNCSSDLHYLIVFYCHFVSKFSFWTCFWHVPSGSALHFTWQKMIVFCLSHFLCWTSAMEGKRQGMWTTKKSKRKRNDIGNAERQRKGYCRHRVMIFYVGFYLFSWFCCYSIIFCRSWAVQQALGVDFAPFQMCLPATLPAVWNYRSYGGGAFETRGLKALFELCFVAFLLLLVSLQIAGVLGRGFRLVKFSPKNCFESR